MTDKELLHAISGQDVESFNVLYGRYNRLLYSRAYSRTGKSRESREIIQDVWINIWENPSFVRTNSDGMAKGFLYHYLSYRILDFFRKEKFHLFHFIDISTCTSPEEIEEQLSYVHVSEEYENRELESQIRSVVNSLPEQTAEIFVLRWRKGYRLKKIAELLHLDERTVRQKSKESIAVMKREMSDESDELREMSADASHS
jgi:RNA polymerase sigma-70 factor (ECF subfamily)